MRFIRRNLPQLLVILAGGGVALGSPQGAAAADQPGECTWCRSSCPSDLTEFCSDLGCGVTSTSCSNENGCQGGSGTWYTYKITCGV